MDRIISSLPVSDNYMSGLLDNLFQQIFTVKYIHISRLVLYKIAKEHLEIKGVISYQFYNIQGKVLPSGGYVD